MPIMPENIPTELKDLDQWVVWKLEERKNGNGEIKKTKVPYQTNGKRADSVNTATWTTFQKACDAAKTGKYDGAGFVFTEESGIVGIDLDHIKNGETWDSEALNEINLLSSYSEISPSGTGAHVFVRATIPGSKRRSGPREMYSSGRFFTVTGNIFSPEREVQSRQHELNALYSKWFERESKNQDIEEQGEKSLSPKLTDYEILQRMRRAKNAAEFEKLYNGDWSGYPSQSEADLKLCSLIAFYTQDPDQVDNIFKSSKLYRSKWNRLDYKEKTISEAIKGLTKTYNLGKTEKKKTDREGPEKINVPFDVVGDLVLEKHHIFSMRDNGNIYMYKNGVYRDDGAEAILDTEIRDRHNEIYEDYWKIMNPGYPLTHIPKATAKYVAETLAYIRAYTHIERKEIDNNQDRYINFANGLFDLDKWVLIEHDPEIRNIAQLPVRYDPNAKCPTIDKYFADCELTEESIKTLEEFAGYCLTPDMKLQKAIMLYGNGSNGKSVFINLLKIILGKEYVSGESLQNLENDKYRVANLYGKRLNAFPDLKDTPLQTNEVFNTLTGNDLELTGERKYQQSFSFKPTVKLLFSANKPPFAYSDNYAYYRRWILIEFPKTFEKNEIDEAILEKMTTDEEMSGFVNKMLEGLKRLQQNRKFTYNPDVDEVGKQYRMQSENVTVFEEECIRDCVGNENPTEKNLVYKFYELWCKQKNLVAVTPTKFTQKMNKIGRKVYNTTKYIAEEKRAAWFSCYFNSIVDFKKPENC